MGLKDYAKNKAKSKVKMVIMSALKPILIKVAIIAGIVALVLIFLASAWGIINQTIVTETSKTVRNSGDEPAVVIDSDSRQYNLDTEFAERVNKLLENKSINAESKGLTEELVTKMYEAEIFTSYPDLRERSKIGTKITGDELQGCIQFIRNYEDGTEQLLEYMDFSEFQRRLAELGRELPDEEGNTVSVGIVTAQSEVERKYNELKKYFTLDSEYNVIIPTISTTTINVDYSEYAEKENNTDTYEYIYTVNYQKINYQSQVKKYAMPIEFPLSLLVITENPGFCEEILELVEDSKIVIEIHDNQTTTTTVQKYDYDGYFNIHKKVNYTVDVEVPDEEQENTEQEEIEPDDPNQGNDEQEDEETITPPNVVKPGGKPNKPNTGYTPELMYYTDNTDLKYEFLSQIKIVKTAITQRHSSSTMSSNDKLLKVKNIDNTPFKTTIEISKQSDIALCIVEARTWLLDLEVTYKKDVNTTSTTESNPLPDEETYTKVNDYHNFLADFEMTLEPGAYNIKTDASSYIEEKKVNQENKTTTTIVDIVYTKESSNIEEKEERFLSLLAVNPLTGEYDKEDRSKNTKIIKYKKATGRTASPVDSILTSKEMLFDLLSVNEESQSLEETMRYLLYIYTGKSYGVTTLDFSIYEPTEFTSIGNSLSGIDGIQGEIYDFLLSKGMSGIGAAAILGNIERESSFNVLAINDDNPHYGLCQWGGSRFERLKTEATNVGKSWQDLQVQLDFLWLELNTSYSSVGQEMMNATDLYVAVEYFTMNYEVCGNYDVEVEKRYEYAEKWYKLASQNNHSGVDDIEKYNLNVYKGFIEYKQLDYTVIPPAYQATSSPAGTIKDKGCMPTSISIILSGMGVKDAWGNAYTPETLISTGTMAHISGGSSTSANAQRTFEKCGLTATETRSTTSAQAKNDILSNLNAGNALLIHASKGYYTGEGHLMTLIDVDGDQVYLSNPGNRNKTGWVSLSTLISRNVDWYMVVSR